MPGTVPEPDVLSLGKLLIGRITALLLLLIFFVPLFGDLLVWVVYGTKFVLSPQFRQVETRIVEVTFLQVLLFIAFVKHAKHFEKKRWISLLVEFLVFIIASLPLALPCVLLVQLMAARGIAALAWSKSIWFMAFMLLTFGCKCKAVFNLWKLTRPVQAQRETRRIVISS